jgi:hypothetical protein
MTSNDIEIEPKLGNGQGQQGGGGKHQGRNQG